MKRRTFLVTTTAALVVASVPVIRYYSNGKKNYHPLVMPAELGNFCEEKTIRDIGIQYRKLVPQESEKVKLEQVLLTDDAGKSISASDKNAVAELLDKKIQNDFNNYDIQILLGWVISVTEARQCALFSLT